MESKLTRKQIQAWNNFSYAIVRLGLSPYVDIIHPRNVISEYNIKLCCSPEIEKALDLKLEFKRDPIILKCAHPGAYISWRECTTTYALQISLLYDANNGYMIDIDCDYGRPFYDVVGWIIHGYEVLYNKVTNSVTNPFKVREALNKRGYGIPLVS